MTGKLLKGEAKRNAIYIQTYNVNSMNKKPKLPKAFAGNLAAIATGLHRRPINADFSSEWKITAKDCKDLLEFMYQNGMISITWIPEKQALCFIKKEYTIN